MPSSIRSRPERGSLLTRLLVLLLLALAPVSTAHAAPDKKTETQARTKFTEGNAAYDKGDFQMALEAYLEAYRLMPLPGFLFNIAQCHRQLGRPERAAIFYRRYLAQSKRPPANAPLVRDLIAEMDAAVQQKESSKSVALRSQGEEVAARRAREESERARAAAIAPAPPAEVKSESLARKWWVWAGAGAVALVAGGVIYAATAPEPRPTTLGTLR